jgi:putative FmdB family regulatory protein
VPTYDYVCEACGHAFEHFQGITEKRLKRCPKCGKPSLVRQVGAGAGLIFKGSGFYQTDYKKTSPPPSESGGGGCGKDACKSTPGTCASDAASSESKPAAKPAKSSKSGSGKA